MDDSERRSGSSDFMVDDPSSVDGQDEYEYPDGSSSDRGQVGSNDEYAADRNDEEQDIFIHYGTVEDDEEDEGYERDQGLYESHRHGNNDDGDDDDDDDDDEDDEEEDDDEDNDDSNNSEPANRRSFTVQDILGNLTQGMEARPQEGGGGISSGSFTRGSGGMNLADVFPEILSLLNDGVHRGTNSFGGGSRNDRISKLVKNVLNADENPYIAMESLREISEHLLMVNQVVVDRVFPVEKLVRGTLSILSKPSLKGELELQLISCRCLCNLFEVHPESILMAVDENLIAILQGILQEISYIDLAEQVLETLELISRLHGRDVLQSGTLASCLQFLDFLTIHAQRKAASIVANSCTKVRMDSFETVQTLFVLMKPVFSNASDQPVVSKLLTALYGVCGGLRDSKMLESLFTFEVVERLLQLVAATDSHLEDRLKCLDILSALVSVSSEISKELLESFDLIGILERCFACYSKNSDAPSHETLMFVPKSLLHYIARTIALLLPTENEQLLSMDAPKTISLDHHNERVDKTLARLTPLLIEIFVNTVDFDIRRCVLVALARILSSLKSTLTNEIDDHIIHLVGTTLAQNVTSLDHERNQTVVSGGLVIGALSLLDIITARFASDFLPGIRREGIVDLVNQLYEFLKKKSEEGKFTVDGEHGAIIEGSGVVSTTRGNGSLSSGEMLDEDEDEEYDTQFGVMDMPDQVKPKKIKFDVLRPLGNNYVYLKSYELSKNLNELFSESEGAVIKELEQIEALVESLCQLDEENPVEQNWSQIWSRVKNSIFNGNFEISSFELISTGLASILAKLVGRYSVLSFEPERTFVEIFDDRLPDFINILQSALSRLESFRIIECGLQGTEGGVASLGKQMKIKLIYDGDAQEDNIAQHLTNITLSIHCIASFKTLSEFLKHRIAQTRFLNSLLPGFSRSSDEDQHGVQGLKDWKFEFSIDGNVLDPIDTIFGAIFKSSKPDDKDMTDIWRNVQVIRFKRIESHSTNDELGFANVYSQRNCCEDELGAAQDILDLLKLARCAKLPDDLFVNTKLSAKISRQLEEPLIVAGGVLPHWCLHLTKNYPFLFPLETRMFFLQCTSFGHGRLIQLWRKRLGNGKETSTDDSLQQLGRVTRHKLRISRSAMFPSGLKILNKYGSSPSILEIEYQDEVGTGLGPTLEFYATMSREFSRKSLNMWRHESFTSRTQEDCDYISAPLFPAPLSASPDGSKTLELFHYLGIFVARSMLDNRILDLNFSTVFFELAHHTTQRQSKKVMDTKHMLHLLALIDPQLASSLKALYRQENLEDLAITFTLPGYDSIELVRNGSSILLTSANLPQYVDQVLDCILGTGVHHQLRCFIEGFSTVFPYQSLLLLSSQEIVHLCGRIAEDWSSHTLYSALVADHGYSMDSATIRDLIFVMSSFNSNERRLFLQFLTGSPKLPIGGFKALHPRLTVVLKHPDQGMSPNAYLPSVMTCANYFKLPKYSSQQIMRSRILQAMHEGSGAFLLS